MIFFFKAILFILPIFFLATSCSGERNQREPIEGGVPSYEVMASGWKIPKQTLPSHDFPVVKADVLEFGAMGDGVTDDTVAFQKAIDKLFKIGGGTLWVPTGRYAFYGNLVIKPNVVIRGEWANPSKNDFKTQGTTFLVYNGKGSEEGGAFITMYPVTGLQSINFWYPEQGLGGEVIAYPPTIQNRLGYDLNNNVTIENVTFVNSWRAITIGPDQNTLWTIRNVNGFPLKTGIEIDDTMDVGRMHCIDFRPNYWSDSDLEGSPSKESKAIQWVYENGTGIRIRKHDFVSYANFRLRGYAIGLAGDHLGSGGDVEERMKEFGNNFFQGHFYDVDIADCKVAVKIKALLSIGVYFSGSSLFGDECGVLIEESEIHPVGFVECSIGGKEYSVNNKGKVYLSLTACKIKGFMHNNGGSLSILDCEFTSDKEYHLELGEAMDIARLNMVQSNNQFRLKNHASEEKVQLVRDRSKSVERIDPLYRHKTFHDIEGLRPGERNLIVYDGKPGPVDDGSEDHTRRAQVYLNQLEEMGGGILFFPAGFYSFYGSLNVPSKVELRGVIDTPIHAARPGTTFNVLCNEGNELDTAFINLNQKSGLKGISFNYPDQNYENIRTYPYTIRGKGKGIYIQNLSSSGNTHFIDFATYQCDEHFVDYVSGCPLKTGIYVGGGSKNGRIYNSQFIGHYWWLFDTVYPQEESSNWVSEKGKFPIPSWFEGKAPERKGSEGLLFEYQMRNLNAFVLGDVENQLMFHNFSYGHLRGIYTKDEGGGGPDALILLHGSDRSGCAADFQALDEGNTMTLVAFMSYAKNKEQGSNIRLGSNVKGTVKMLDAEIGGHHWLGINMEGGSLYINQCMISILEGGLAVSDHAKLTLNSPFIMWGSKFKKPEDILLKNATLQNFYFLRKKQFIYEH
jgi:hypothetical protein